jgi:hypothetical protein
MLIRQYLLVCKEPGQPYGTQERALWAGKDSPWQARLTGHMPTNLQS